RVVSATHRDLRAEVNRKQFRADLYYRLTIARIILPPLRERLEDLEDLVLHFVTDISGRADPTVFTPAAIEALRAQRWTGNVRELRNVIETTLAMGRLTLDEASLRGPDEAGALATMEPYRDARRSALIEFESKYLRGILDAVRTPSHRESLM